MSEITTEQFYVDPNAHWDQFDELAEFFNERAVRQDYQAAGRGDVLDRYADPRTALQSVRRLDQATTMQGGPIRKQHAIVGTWTTIEDFRMLQPGALLRTIGGMHIDYAARDLTIEEHVQVVDQLVLKRQQVGDKVLALLAAEEEDMSAGIPVRMENVGGCGRVRFPLSRLATSRHYGLVYDKRPLQLYQSSLPVRGEA